MVSKAFPISCSGEALPNESSVNAWGDEIYFDIALRIARKPDVTTDEEVGDLAYRPDGAAFCIFFGPTPVNRDERLRASSPLNVFGPVPADARLFKKIAGGAPVKVARPAWATGRQGLVPPVAAGQSMQDFLKKFERVILLSLSAMMVVVVGLATFELGWIIIRDIITTPIILLEINELLEIFGFFLLVLIGIELLETIKAYLHTGVVHVEIVLEVALIAIARKVIILDIDKYEGLTLVGIASLISAVALAFLVAKRHVKEGLRRGS